MTEDIVKIEHGEELLSSKEDYSDRFNSQGIEEISQEKFFEGYEDVDYKIEKGMTLEDVARKLNVDINELAMYNDIKNISGYTGIIKVPSYVMER